MSIKPHPARDPATVRGPRTPHELAMLYSVYLNCLGRALKSVSLYWPTHPEVLSSIKDALAALEMVFAATGEGSLVLCLSDEGLMANGHHVSEGARTLDPIKSLFKGRGISNLTFLKGVGLPDLSAFAGLVPVHTSDSTGEDFAEGLARAQVRCITVDQKRYKLVHAMAPPAPKIPTPPAPRTPTPPPVPVPPPQAELQSPPTQSSHSFGALLKTLVESAVNDPDERVHVYNDALNMVREALNKRVAGATEQLHQEKRLLLNTQERTARVLANVAEGKVIVDREGNILMMNAAAEAISGKRLIEVAGRHISQNVNPEVQMVTMANDLSPSSDGASKDIRIIAQQEVERALKRSLALIHDETGQMVGTYAVLPDVVKFKETVRLQEEFLSRVTHDLKAPLSALCCGLEFLTERVGPGLPVQESHFLSVCLRNGRELARMINEILDFSKLESGHMTVHPVPTPMAGMIQDAVESLGPWARTKGLTLMAAPVGPEIVVVADAVRVVQILTNLLANAIKSTPENGTVEVRVVLGAGRDTGQAVVSVCDTGCGIPPESLGRIFEKFVQLEGATGPREGVGLGLAIVSDLVELHKGRIWVDSEVGKGSTFSFTLALAARAPN